MTANLMLPELADAHRNALHGDASGAGFIRIAKAARHAARSRNDSRGWSLRHLLARPVSA